MNIYDTNAFILLNHIRLKRVLNCGKAFGWNADPIVPDRNLQKAALRFCADMDKAILSKRFNTMLDSIFNNGLQDNFDDVNI